jgi:hypothetical protein
VNAVLEALRGLGLEDDRIQSDRQSVTPRYQRAVPTGTAVWSGISRADPFR